MFKNIARVAYVATGLVVSSAPFMALADVVTPGEFGPGAADPNFSRATGIVQGIGGIVNILVPIAITAALLFFIWGLAQFVMNSGDPEKKGEGKTRMIQGIIALFVIVSVWGIIAWIGSQLGVKQGGGIPTPRVDVGYPIPGVGNTNP